MITINLFCDIDNQTLSALSETLHGVEPGSDVRLNICSNGGYVFEALAIVDMLSAYNTEATIMGLAASAAAIIAMSCKKVKMYPHAALMLHSAWCEGVDDKDDGIVAANNRQLSIINKRCSDYTYDELMEKDHWYDPDEALARGFIDEISTVESGLAAFVNKMAAKFSIGVKAMDENQVTPVVEEAAQAVEEAVDEAVEQGSPDLASALDAILKRVEALEARIEALTAPQEAANAKLNDFYARLFAPKASKPAQKAESNISPVDISKFM